MFPFTNSINQFNQPVPSQSANYSFTMLELPNYTALKTSLTSGILFVTFHNPESPIINLWGRNTQSELTDLTGRLEVDNDTKVVVFNSDVPRFFIAHLDASILAEPNGRMS
jgi:enoyl-CoA hydratase/carnithine racemase